MTDAHIRILRLVAHQAQRELHDHDLVDHIGYPASTPRREDLELAAARTRTHVADANARRRNQRLARSPNPDSYGPIPSLPYLRSTLARQIDVNASEQLCFRQVEHRVVERQGADALVSMVGGR